MHTTDPLSGRHGDGAGVGIGEQALIRAVVPEPAVAVDVRGELPDAGLFPAEQAAISRAVATRQQEFTTARACAREALRRLGIPPVEIGTGAKGEPQWPEGIVGSITHCSGYRGAVVARASQITAIGIDTEPNKPMPDGVLDAVSLPDERAWIARLAEDEPEVAWDRLLFCAKEAVYKTWYPIARRWLGFEEALVSVDPAAGTFEARLTATGPDVHGVPLTGFSGRWAVREALIMTAIVLHEPKDAQGDGAFPPVTESECTPSE
ncbi:MAG TPA: 4'-phosphopantetheinyl transferase superfamily protein [Actinocrinis sp.]